MWEKFESNVPVCLGNRVKLLTAITTGAITPQVQIQYLWGWYPVIWATQSPNLLAPKIHPMAIVWKKQHQSIGIPEAL